MVNEDFSTRSKIEDVGRWYATRFVEYAGKWNYIFYPIAWLLSLFGQTGRMTVWARRTS